MKKMSLREYLHSINESGKITDVSICGWYVDTVLPPIKLTHEGEKKFGRLLDNKHIYVEEDDIQTDNRQIKNQYIYDYCGVLNDVALFLLTLHRTYCLIEEYKEWFDGDDAKLV